MRKGHTLVESLIVLALLFTMSSFATIPIYFVNKKYSLINVTHKLVNEIQHIQFLAKSKGIKYCFNYEPDSPNYSIISDGKIEKKKLASCEFMNNRVRQFIFYPNGRCMTGTFRLCNKTHFVNVEVRLTGAITYSKPILKDDENGNSTSRRDN